MGRAGDSLQAVKECKGSFLKSLRGLGVSGPALQLLETSEKEETSHSVDHTISTNQLYHHHDCLLLLTTDLLIALSEDTLVNMCVLCAAVLEGAGGGYAGSCTGVY